MWVVKWVWLFCRALHLGDSDVDDDDDGDGVDDEKRVGELCGRIAWENCVGELCGRIVWENCVGINVCPFPYLMARWYILRREQCRASAGATLLFARRQ